MSLRDMIGLPRAEMVGSRQTDTSWNHLLELSGYDILRLNELG
jgi:hypothetical protein